MFKVGDVVRLNELGRSARGLGNKECVQNPCSERLLAGETLAVSKVVPVFEGSRRFSLLFCGASYSFSQDYFELAS